MRAELECIRAWAGKKIQGGSEPPWAWYQYMKLVETIDAILAGMAAVGPGENLPQSAQRPGTPLRLVDSTFQPDVSQPHQVGLPIQPPM